MLSSGPHQNIEKFPICQLPDDVLEYTLQHKLMSCCCVASPSAVRKRQRHLKHLYAHSKKPMPPRALVVEELGGDREAAWSACLAGLGGDSDLLEYPPWRQSTAADGLYTAISGLPAAARVCKKWWDVLKNSVKVAVCDVGVMPPPSTQVLVAVGHLDGIAARDLAYVRGLASLKALVFYCISEACDFASRRERANTLLPAVPHGLETLQHLLLDGPALDSGLVHLTEAAARSIATLQSLRSLFIPELVFKNDYTSEQLISALPRLENLSAYHMDYSAARCAAWTALRRLCMPADRGEDISPLSRLHALESLILEAGCGGGAVGFAALKQLKRLTLWGYSDAAPMVEQLADLPALSELWISTCNEECAAAEAAADVSLAAALAALPQPPKLWLSMVSDADLSGIAQLTHLQVAALHVRVNTRSADQDLQLDVTEGEISNFEIFGALTQLTTLAVHSRDNTVIPGEACDALQHLTLLQKLQASRCTLSDPSFLQALPALHELRLGECCVDDADAWLAAAQLPHACPMLELLHVRLPSPWTRARMDSVARLSALEELDICGNELMEASLARLESLKRLRVLYLDRCRGLYDAGLTALVACSSLQCVTASETGVTGDDVTALTAKGVLVSFK